VLKIFLDVTRNYVAPPPTPPPAPLSLPPPPPPPPAAAAAAAASVVIISDDEDEHRDDDVDDTKLETSADVTNQPTNVIQPTSSDITDDGDGGEPPMKKKRDNKLRHDLWLLKKSLEDIRSQVDQCEQFVGSLEDTYYY